jgi:hypothetical protein
MPNYFRVMVRCPTLVNWDAVLPAVWDVTENYLLCNIYHDCKIYMHIFWSVTRQRTIGHDTVARRKFAFFLSLSHALLLSTNRAYCSYKTFILKSGTCRQYKVPKVVVSISANSYSQSYLLWHWNLLTQFSGVVFRECFEYTDRLCGLVVRVPGYRSRGPGSISSAAKFFWEVMGLERGPLSLVSTTEELLGRNSTGSCLETLEYGRVDPLRWPRDTLYPQKLALTMPTSGGRLVVIVRSRTKATEFLSVSVVG